MADAVNNRRPDKGERFVRKDWHIHEEKGRRNEIPDDSKETAKMAGVPESGLAGHQKLTAKLKRNADLFYANFFIPKSGLIIATDIYGRGDDGDVAPSRWCDVAFPLWEELANKQEFAPNSLKFVIQNMVVSSVGNRLIREIFPPARRVPGPDNTPPSMTFTPSDADFYALLQTPNGVGSAYLCINYATSLNFAAVQSISLFYFDSWGGSFTLLIKLGHPQTVNQEAEQEQPREMEGRVSSDFDHGVIEKNASREQQV